MCDDFFSLTKKPTVERDRGVRLSMLNSILFSACVLLCSPVALAVSTLDEKDPIAVGGYFYHLQKYKDAAHYLEFPAEAGDAESQYLMGNIQRVMSDWAGYPTLAAIESRAWYVKAAQQNHVYAMMRLVDKERPSCDLSWDCPPGIKQSVPWQELALVTATQKANKGNAEAMLQLYLLTEQLDWLVRSAEAGFVEAQYRLSLEYRKEKGDFATTDLCQQAADKWLLAAAEGGYIPAMGGMKELMLAQNNIQGFKHWVERGAKAGGLIATSDYSAYFPERWIVIINRLTCLRPTVFNWRL